jgi:hypothetical protein
VTVNEVGQPREHDGAHDALGQGLPERRRSPQPTRSGHPGAVGQHSVPRVAGPGRDAIQQRIGLLGQTSRNKPCKRGMRALHPLLSLGSQPDRLALPRHPTHHTHGQIRAASDNHSHTPSIAIPPARARPHPRSSCPGASIPIAHAVCVRLAGAPLGAARIAVASAGRSRSRRDAPARAHRRARDDAAHVRPVGVSQSVDLGAGVEQVRCDRDRVGRRLLAEVLDAVGGDVVQKRRVMPPRRARPGKAQIGPQQRAERPLVAAHDRFGRHLERVTGNAFDMTGELGPALEPVRAGQHPPRVGQCRRTLGPHARDGAVDAALHEAVPGHTDRLKPRRVDPTAGGELVRQPPVVLDVRPQEQRNHVHPGPTIPAAEERLPRSPRHRPSPSPLRDPAEGSTAAIAVCRARAHAGAWT